jgi:formylglycine-generating enzyme required for sulfatase activity
MKYNISVIFLMLILFINNPYTIVAQTIIKKKGATKSCCTATIPNRFGVKTKSNSKEKLITNTPTTSPMGMVWIPGGTFAMGGDNEQARQGELPKHEVKLSGFFHF